jgi:aspartate-semialdehyde dehydrogenase
MDGYTKEEWKMTVETRKILDPDIEVTATCVRVPVFVGHSEAINVEFEMPLSVAKAQSLLREAPGIMLVDKREPISIRILRTSHCSRTRRSNSIRQLAEIRFDWFRGMRK